MIRDRHRLFARLRTEPFASAPHEQDARYDHRRAEKVHSHGPTAALARRALGRMPPAMLVLLLGVLVVAAVHGAIVALRPAGQAIRDELSAAAVAVGALPENAPADKVVKTVRWYFRDRRVAVDPSEFPAVVAVTLKDIDRKSCLEAESEARRIARLVVVQLVGYNTAADCEDSNAMTWRIMP